MTESFVAKVLSESVGVSYPAITANDLVNIKIAIPPKDLQRKIVLHLHQKTSKIEEAITGHRKTISLLRERKQIIINEVVTGKVKVS